MRIAIDFDGTCVYHEFPAVGADVPGAVDTLRDLVKAGHHLIPWTVRGGEHIGAAVRWFKDRGILLLGVNENPGQHEWSSSPKAYCHRYIDDAAVGCPLIFDKSVSDRPFVDWASVRTLLGEVLNGEPGRSR